jgi:hypothetical protein
MRLQKQIQDCAVFVVAIDQRSYEQSAQDEHLQANIVQTETPV